MFKELAKHSYLGSIKEFQFLFDNVISCDEFVTYLEIEHACKRKPFLFRSGIKPIIDYLIFIGLIETTNDDKYKLDCKEYDLRRNHNLAILIVNSLFTKLNLYNEFESLFDERTLEFDNIHESYLIRSYYIKSHLSNVKRLLIDIGFFKIDSSLKTSLIIREEFVDFFEEFLPIKSRKRLSLDKLKELNELNERLGKDAELYVLKLEQERLKSHILFSQISRISEENVSAGYDIESFNSLSSSVNDFFIEVKSFSREIRFYWTSIEVEVAKKLKEKYCLCLVDRMKMSDNSYHPVYIVNPHEEIFAGSGVWNIKVEKWLIEHS